MAKLQIRIFEINDQTVSKFEVTNTEKVVFFNHGADVLTIEVKDSPMPGPVLCGKKNDKDPVLAPFTISVSEKKKDFFICEAYKGDSFTYSAEIKGAAIEDPIVIIEKSKSSDSIMAILPALGAGLIAGIVLTLIAQRLVRPRRTT